MHLGGQEMADLSTRDCSVDAFRNLLAQDRNSVIFAWGSDTPSYKHVVDFLIREISLLQ